jgi:hypothetical protein
VQSFLSSDLPDEYFETLEKLSLLSPTGNLVQITIDAFMRNMSDMTVTLSTPYGTVTVGETYYAAKDWDSKKKPFFTNAGFNETVWFSNPYNNNHQAGASNRRRLVGYNACRSCILGSSQIPAPAPKPTATPTKTPTQYPTYKYLPTAKPTVQVFDKSLWVVKGYFSGTTASCNDQCKGAGFSSCDRDQALTLSVLYPQSWVTAVWPNCKKIMIANNQFPYAISLATQRNPVDASACFYLGQSGLAGDYCTSTVLVNSGYNKNTAVYPFCACKK